MIKNHRTVEDEGIKITACEVDDQTRNALSTNGAKLPPLESVPEPIAWLFDDFIIPNWMMIFIVICLLIFAGFCFTFPFNVSDSRGCSNEATKAR